MRGNPAWWTGNRTSDENRIPCDSRFRYFNSKDWAPTIVDPVYGQDGKYLDNSGETSVPRGLPERVFSGGIPGKPHNAPESRLVDSYVAWLSCESDFVHYYLPSERLHTDLFNPLFPTRGTRAGSSSDPLCFYHHPQGTPSKQLFWVPVAGRRWRNDWQRTRRGT